MSDATITLVVPWHMVAHDNHRLMPARIGKAVRLITAPDYRAAKEAATWELKRQWGQRAKLVGPLQLVGIAHFPDSRKRDAGNYRKLLTDALTEIAYGDDAQLHREVWERGSNDKQHPRIELRVSPLQREDAQERVA